MTRTHTMTDEKARAAGTRVPQRQALGMSTAELVETTKVSRELGSTYRVYVKEWVFDSRHDSEAQALAHYVETYEGRLQAGDSEIVADFDNTFALRLRLWNVAAEWKREHLAEGFAAALVEDGRALKADIQVVARNSRLEHSLKAYAVLKLPSSHKV